MRFGLLLLSLALSAQCATYYVTIAGLGGEADYEAQFVRLANDLDKQLKLNGPDTHVETISGKAATRQYASELFDRLATQIQPDDAFGLFLIGHGTFDGSEYKFNVPGPDITAENLGAWLAKIRANRQLVVNMTSCSGASMAALAAKHRIVITATKSGNEKNATVFPRYFSDALHDTAADTDKNGVTSALEAFRYTVQKVSGYFTSEKLIASEHALFNDTGTASSVRDPEPGNQQGLLAGAFPLLRPASEVTLASTNPQKKQLLAHRDELQARIDRLKYQKEGMAADEYKQQLTALLLDLARTQAELDK